MRTFTVRLSFGGRAGEQRWDRWLPAQVVHAARAGDGQVRRTSAARFDVVARDTGMAARTIAELVSRAVDVHGKGGSLGQSVDFTLADLEVEVDDPATGGGEHYCVLRRAGRYVGVDLRARYVRPRNDLAWRHVTPEPTGEPPGRGAVAEVLDWAPGREDDAEWE